MSELSWAHICAREESALVDLDELCRRVDAVEVSPVDALYADIAEIVRLGKPPDLAASPALGRLMILGLVASTEHYFRTVLASLVSVCPLSRGRVSDQQIRFGALDYYNRDEVALSLMENQSLASTRELRKHIERVLGKGTQESSSLTAALALFGQVCELRHAAAHQRGGIGSHSAKALGLDPGGSATVIPSFQGIQGVAAVCISVARSFNRFAFEMTAKEWILNGVLRFTWASDRSRFVPLFELMHSRNDAVGPANAYLAWRSLMAWRVSSGFGVAKTASA